MSAIQESSSFNSTEVIFSSLAKKIHLLSCRSIGNILSAVQNGMVIGGYNQSLDLGYAYFFLTEMLKESYKKGCDLNIWKNFYEGLDESDQERFYDIRKSLQAHSVEFDTLKYIHPDDIPF